MPAARSSIESSTTFRDSFAAWVSDCVDSMIFMESSMRARAWSCSALLRSSTAHVEFLGRLLGFAPLLSLRRDPVHLVVREFTLAQDLDFRKARTAEIAPGFARQELLPGDDLADLVVRVAHLLYVVGLELALEEILLEALAAHVLIAALQA